MKHLEIREMDDLSVNHHTKDIKDITTILVKNKYILNKVPSSFPNKSKSIFISSPINSFSTRSLPSCNNVKYSDESADYN